MTNATMIESYYIPEIKLDYVLNHCLEGEWSDAEVAQSRYKVQDKTLSLKDIRDAKIKTFDSELLLLLNDHLDTCVNEYAKKHNIGTVKNEAYHVVRYYPGQFFAEHTDATEEFPRKISAVFYLNDNYDGGTITFSNFNHKVKPEANTLLVFPSTEEFKHSADPVISGIKYAIVGFWI